MFSLVMYKTGGMNGSNIGLGGWGKGEGSGARLEKRSVINLTLESGNITN